MVDASVLAPVVADGGEHGQRCRARLRGERIAGPDLLRIEVASVLRRRSASGHLTPEEAGAAINDLLAVPLSVFPTAPLLRRAWALRDTVSAYDACYVALAEALDRPLLTPTGASLAPRGRGAGSSWREGYSMMSVALGENTTRCST